MPMSKFGGKRNRISVHENPTRSSHATSKKYVDTTLDNMMRNLKIEFEHRMQSEMEKMDYVMMNAINAALTPIRTRLSRIERLKKH